MMPPETGTMPKYLAPQWLQIDLERHNPLMTLMASTIICGLLSQTYRKEIVRGALPVGFTAMAPMQMADQARSITTVRFHTANAIACFNGTTKHFLTSVRVMILVVVACPRDPGSMSRLPMMAQQPGFTSMVPCGLNRIETTTRLSETYS